MSGSTILLTGFPSNELARRVLPRLLELSEDTEVEALVPDRFVEHANEWLSALPPSQRARTNVIIGDVASIDLGLSGREYLDLAARVNVIHHCAAVTYSGAPMTMAERVNVGGTFEVLELGRNALKLERIVHWSSIAASGGQTGSVREDELIEPRAGTLAHTRYQAEKLVRKACGEVPITVIRTAMLVGDSRTGRLARIEGAHLLISALLTAPRDVPLLRPAHGDVVLQVVPIDYAVDAGLAIARSPQTIDRTFHVIDRSALGLDEALVLIADLVGKPQPRGGLPPRFTQALMRLPGIDRLIHAQRALLDELLRDVCYDDQNAQPVLAEAGLRCPGFASYVEKLVAHVERERRSERAPALPSFAR
jgi:thioester reductase-like protein